MPSIVLIRALCRYSLSGLRGEDAVMQYSLFGASSFYLDCYNGMSSAPLRNQCQTVALIIADKTTMTHTQAFHGCEVLNKVYD